jgi:hypothetical protein
MLSPTYNLVRLVNIDGEKHDFIYATPQGARKAFELYQKYAQLDEKHHGATVSVTDTSVDVRKHYVYNLSALLVFKWRAEMILDLGMEGEPNV